MMYKFFTREGGVSEGIYASLNCGPGSKDNPEHVAENRRRAAQAFGASTEQLYTLHQIHSADVIVIDKDSDASQRPQADAMVTDRVGVVLGILTADCTPVLFHDPVARIIGAAHAGWKGAHGGIIQRTIEAMQDLGAKPERMRAMIGPTIQQRSYEVGPEFHARFTAEEQHRCFIASVKAGHFMFDLPGYVTRKLIAAGVTNIENQRLDTCSDPAHYFSYRRTTLHAEPDYGRQLSAIMLQE
jgi:polyphenol oxidase